MPNPIILDKDRIEYRDYFQWFKGDLATLWNVPATLINGLKFLDVPNDVLTEFNYFKAASKYYISAVTDNVPEALDSIYPLFRRMVEHWAVTGEYCLVIENGVINTIRPDYVFPIRKPDNYDIIQGYYFIFPLSINGEFKARVIHYDIATGIALENTRDLVGDNLEDKRGGTPVNIQGVIWEKEDGFYKDIKGLVRELNVRYALLQLALNSTAIPLLQVATEGMGGGLVGADGITPTRIAGIGKSGLGLVVPPPFTGEEGARYIERAGTGLEESLAYVRMILGSLSVLSGVPEYVHGISLSQSTAEVERVMFMGESRIESVQRAMTNTFRQLGLEVVFGSQRIGENNAS